MKNVICKMIQNDHVLHVLDCVNNLVYVSMGEPNVNYKTLGIFDANQKETNPADHDLLCIGSCNFTRLAWRI